MLQAGAMGVPFIPVRALYGSDLLHARADFKVIEDPYQPGQRVVLAPALRPDLFIAHGAVADRWGNVITVDDGRNDLLAAQAARRTLVTVEQISADDLTPVSRPGWTFIPAVYVSAVAPAPGGSAPAGFAGLYPCDGERLRAYAQAGRSDDAFAQHLATWLDHSPR